MAIVTQVDISHQIHPGESTPEDDWTSRFVMNRQGIVIEEEGCS